MAVYKSKKPTKDCRQYFFRIKYKDIYGISHDYTSPKFKTKKEADEEEARYRIKISDNKANTSNITLEQVFYDFLEVQKTLVKKQTIIKDVNFYRHIKPLGKYKVNAIDLNVYRRWLIELKETPVGVIYKNKILGLFKRLIRYANIYYNTSDSLIKFIENFKDVGKQKKEMQFFTYEEYLQFDKVIDDLDWHTFFEMLYFLGLRKGECIALTWNDIDFKKGIVNITKTLTTKIKGEKWTISSPKTKNSIRVIPLTKNLTKDLKTLKENAQHYVDYSDEWFIFGNTRPLSENTIQIRKDKYCRLAGVKQIRIHDFRHSCASLLINKGASIALVSKYLGHSNISITLNTYTHMYKSELEQMTNILNNL